MNLIFDTNIFLFFVLLNLSLPYKIKLITLSPNRRTWNVNIFQIMKVARFVTLDKLNSRILPSVLFLEVIDGSYCFFASKKKTHKKEEMEMPILDG